MVTRIRATAGTMLSGAALAAFGIVLVAGTASASPAPPSATIVDGGDGYLNGSEVSAVKVNGTYAAGTNAMKVRLVASATCDPNATPTKQIDLVSPGYAFNPAGATYEVTFNLSDADPSNAAPNTWPEGTAVCALTRSSIDGGITYGMYGTSTNKPVKDTQVLAGTVSIIDADGNVCPVMAGGTPTPCYLNGIDAALANNGIDGAWSKTAGSDATGARVWWNDESDGTPLTIPAGCGPFPTSTTYHPASSVSGGGSQPDQPLSQSCASVVTEGGQISFNAFWRDAAGNVSAPVSTSATPGANIIKDTIAPAVPLVEIQGLGIDGGRPALSGITRNVINASNAGAVNVQVQYNETDLDYIDLIVNDAHAGTPPLDWRGDALDPDLFDDDDDNGDPIDPGEAPYATDVTFDMSVLRDCIPNVVNPQALAASDCISATAQTRDIAGNLSAISSPDTALKDTLAPLAPSPVRFVPNQITDINSPLTELELTGERFSEIFVKVNDGDPASLDLANHASLGDNGQACRLHVPCVSPVAFDDRIIIDSSDGFEALNVDVTPLADGTLTASVFLVDPWGNAGPIMTATATKDFTTPSLTLLSPVPGSLSGKLVSFSGIARFEGVACNGCRITVFQRNNPNYNHPDNIAMLTTTSAADGRWSGKYQYLASGIMRAYFRAFCDSACATANPAFDDPAVPGADANKLNGRPSAVSEFRVDAFEPNQDITTPTSNVYPPGEAVVIRGDATDDFSGVLAVRISVYNVANPRLDTTSNPPVLRPNIPIISEQLATCSGCPAGKRVSWSYDLTSLPSGYYTVQAVAVDNAGQRAKQFSEMTFLKL